MLLEASPEQLERYRALKQRREELRLAQSHVGRWYCDVPGCTGEPHEGFHWCEHPIGSEDHTWECRHARANQHPPVEFEDHTARIWLLMAGRGFGKTRAGAEWLAERVRQAPGLEWGVVARTTDDLRATCFEGMGGLLRCFGMERDDRRYNKTSIMLRLDDGTKIHSYSAEEPSSVHGPNLAGVWADEVGKWKSREMWDSLSFAIRHGDAQTCATTTPTRTDLIRDFVKRDDGSVVITRGSTFENERNLAASFIAEQKIRWEGTRLGRQELYGELLDDVPGALFTGATIASTRGVLIR